MLPSEFKTQFEKRCIKKKPARAHNLHTVVQSVKTQVKLFLEDVYPQPIWNMKQRGRNLFSKLLILQNNQPPPWKPEPPAEQRRYCSLREESWRGLLHLSIFPPLLFFHPPFVSHSVAKDRFRPSRLSGEHGIA